MGCAQANLSYIGNWCGGCGHLICSAMHRASATPLSIRLAGRNRSMRNRLLTLPVSKFQGPAIAQSSGNRCQPSLLFILRVCIFDNPGGAIPQSTRKQKLIRSAYVTRAYSRT